MRPSTSLLTAIAASSHAFSGTLPLNCTPNGSTMMTPSYGADGAVFTVCAQDTINSSPSQIYDVLLDFPKYSLWNKFVYLVDLPPNVRSAQDVYVDMKMTLHTSGIVSGVNLTDVELVTFLEPDYGNGISFMAWRFYAGSLGELFLRAEHVSLLLDLYDGTTKYVSWDTYYLVGAYALLLTRANMQKEFEIQGQNLKGYVEGLSSSRR